MCARGVWTAACYESSGPQERDESVSGNEEDSLQRISHDFGQGLAIRGLACPFFPRTS